MVSEIKSQNNENKVGGLEALCLMCVEFQFYKMKQFPRLDAYQCSHT